MKDHEKYLFDLNGYLVIKNALTSDEVTQLNEAIDRRHVSEKLQSTPYFHTGFPDVMLGNNDPAKGPVDLADGSLLDWGPEFRRLTDLPQILPYLEELLKPEVRFDHAYGVFGRKGGDNNVGMHLHHGGAPHDPSQSYYYRDGEMYNGLLAVSYALTPAGPGSGGFCVIPGSHKANFPLPESVQAAGSQRPVQHVPVEAGDAVIFTEATTHGTLPWSGANERRILLYKYCPSYMQWEKSSPGASVDDRFTPEQQSLMLSPYASGRRRPK
ncbi:phytanoyl-CoA dioxygenase family protein [Streptomyces filamentosus]|uniref:phytanoyl-CoA dioxygenase family protein n=1 Tax=Streptomyces filamentosus TaxID=67294 RepID=UPI003409F458